MEEVKLWNEVEVITRTSFSVVKTFKRTANEVDYQITIIGINGK